MDLRPSPLPRRLTPLLALAAAVAAVWAVQATGTVAKAAVKSPAKATTRSTTKQTKRASHKWPFSTLQLGLENGPGEAAQMHAAAPFTIRYQYLSGGVNTNNSWQNWDTGGLSYVEDYISESERAHLLPVFTYYQLLQSQPGAQASGQQAADDRLNLVDMPTMQAYYADLTAFFHAAASTRKPVVLHFEPDAFGYAEQDSTDNNAASVPADVSSTGIPALKGLPNTVAGWAQAVVLLRNKYAPNVILAYADSIWGTGFDIHQSHPTASQVTYMAARSAAWYRSLHAKFNVIFTEVDNEDAGEWQVEQGNNLYWWHKVDYARDLEYLRDLHRELKLPLVIWQIPIGNTIMRAMNNTPYHWQDNHVQNYLGAGARGYLKQLVKAGVVALLFGSPQTTGTTALPKKHAARFNPTPINGNRIRAYSSADDGGYLIARAQYYYHGHTLKLPR